MKKHPTLLLTLLIFYSLTSLVIAQDPPAMPVGVGDGDVEKIQDAIDTIPIDEDTGGFDPSKLEGTKSKAEERIEKFNQWLTWSDSFFLFVFKIPARINWEFTYLFFLVLLSLSAFHNLPTLAMDKEAVNWLVGFSMTFVMGFFGIFKLIVNGIVLITNKWWWDVVVTILLIGLISFMGWVAVWQRKKRIKNAENKTIEAGKRAKEEAEFIGELGDALSEGLEED